MGRQGREGWVKFAEQRGWFGNRGGYTADEMGGKGLERNHDVA